MRSDFDKQKGLQPQSAIMTPSMMTSVSPDNVLETGLALIQRELQVMKLLFDISQALNKSLNLAEAMQPILKMMSEHAGNDHPPKPGNRRD